VKAQVAHPEVDDLGRPHPGQAEPDDRLVSQAEVGPSRQAPISRSNASSWLSQRAGVGA
jgi:hypothetical protein